MEAARKENVEDLVLDRLDDSTIWCRRMAIFTSSELLVVPKTFSRDHFILPKN